MRFLPVLIPLALASLAAGDAVATDAVAKDRDSATASIEHPEKIGIGIWDKDNRGTAFSDVSRSGMQWHYNWSGRALSKPAQAFGRTAFIAMAWGERDVTQQSMAMAKASGAKALLGFNEPDDRRQSFMSVERAISLWPQLEATGMRLGSPAPTQHGVLGSGSWLGRFMAEADKRNLRVDFIAVHYYSKDKDVGAFKAWLEAVHEQYKKPVWVTEWALADWDNPSRFSAKEQAEFARAGVEMMDDLEFVERHAWFAAYEGGDGWHLNSGIFGTDGRLTEVGKVFSQFAPRLTAERKKELDVDTTASLPLVR